MAVLRTQHALKAASTVCTNGASTTIAIPRPLTLPAEEQTIDHVSRPAIRDEFLGGAAFITLPSALQNAALYIRQLAVVKAPNASVPLQRYDDVVSLTADLSQASLFPSGASTSGVRYIINTDSNIFPTNGADVLSLLDNISLMENESLSLTVYNGSGGDLTGAIEVHYDFGVNSGQLSLRAVK